MIPWFASKQIRNVAVSSLNRFIIIVCYNLVSNIEAIKS